MRPFQELTVWQKAHLAVLDVYSTTAQFPSHEQYGLISQMRRSASSVPTNIAEGSVYDSGWQFYRYLGMALASSTELEYQLILARDLNYIPADVHRQLDKDLAEVKRMLVAFRKTQRPSSPTNSGPPTKS